MILSSVQLVYAANLNMPLQLVRLNNQMQDICASKRQYSKPPKNHYTFRKTQNGTSFTSRTKIGNTTVIQTRTAKGKHKNTRTTKNANVTNTLQY